jgi:hypothetical protein
MSAPLHDVEFVLKKLRWMRERRIWPNGLRYLWTDAFGVVLLVSVYRHLREQRYLDDAEWLVAEVERVLGRPRGIRIGKPQTGTGNIFTILRCGFMR